MLKQLILMNYATVILIVCLLIFILTNNYFDQKVRKLFLTACLLVLCLVVVDSVEYWTATLNHPSTLRIWMSAIGYSLRPAIIFVVILLLLRYKTLKQIIWLAVPSVLNTILAFSALFTDIVFSYSFDNQFVRGPLGYFVFITSGFYAIGLLIYTINLCKSVRFSEAIISIAVVCMFGISTAMESLGGYDGVINTTGAVALVFYYLYLNTQQFKKDPMTHVLNRRCFFLDAENNMDHLSAVISIDLNNLKQWNDKYGHAKGDEAICTLARCTQKVLPRNCFLYRTGGDEFMILCFHKKENTINQLPHNIKAEMANTPFSCSIGLAYNNLQEDFNELCSRADNAMYQDKSHMKHMD